MATVLNLNKARKAKEKQDAEQRAAQNRVLHGQTKAQKQAVRRDAIQQAERWAAHKREAPTPPDVPQDEA